MDSIDAIDSIDSTYSIGSFISNLNFGSPDFIFDGNGNYNLGIKEHIIFPEINYESVTDIWGMDVVISTSANTDEEALMLLKGFNFPFGN